MTTPTIPKIPADASEAAEQRELAAAHADAVDAGLEDDGSIDLLELLVRFLAEWRIGLAAAAVTMVLGTIYVYKTRPQFESTATILPKQNFAESNSLTTLFSGRHPEDLYTGLLHSRSVTDNVIRELNLAPKGDGTSWEATRNGLLGSLTVVPGADGLLRVRVRSPDAKMAMKIANAYLSGLNLQQQNMALTQSVQNRQFFEEQLAQERKALIAAETDLEKTQKATGVIEIGPQTSVGLGQIAGVRSQITALEVQLAALLQSATEENPQVKTLRSQISQLQVQERTYEAGGVTGAGAPITAGRMPELNLEYERKQREVRFHEGLLNSLNSQYQNARMVEASAADAFQVVDYAIEPEHRSYPPRSLWLGFSAGFSFVMGIFAIFFVLIKRRVQADADYRRHILAIKQNFRLRRQAR